jgi:hypothetical protein
MFHEGDEMLTSLAIEHIMNNGMPVYDAGNLGFIIRFWSINSRHHQKSFDAFTNCFLLHLPADKKLLSSLADQEAEYSFIKKYRRHLLKRKPREITSNLYRSLFS